MKSSKALSLVGFMCLALVLVLLPLTGACGKLAPPASRGEAVYTVLDPRGSEPEVEYQGLSPRLDTLEGKKVGIINMGGAGAEIMETIGPDLEAAVPGCTTVYLEAGHEPAAMGGVSKLIESCDAIILGHNY